MQDFLDRLKTLGEPGSDIRDTAETAARTLERSLANVQPVITMAQQQVMREAIASVKAEIAKGGTLEALLTKFEKSPLFFQHTSGKLPS